VPLHRGMPQIRLAAALPAVSCLARAQAYPTRPVRWIVPAAAGNASDIVARLMAQWLSERLGACPDSL
jgi:tripartite-type tricarboxylate transporter receptor subunit TctC